MEQQWILWRTNSHEHSFETINASERHGWCEFMFMDMDIYVASHRARKSLPGTFCSESSRRNGCDYGADAFVLEARWLKWLEREFTDRKVHGSNPNSASRLPLSRLRQLGNIPALVFPSGGMTARYRRGVTAESSTDCAVQRSPGFPCGTIFKIPKYSGDTLSL
ncbi:hypothetical protein CSKR_103530 [Clonorchis sinensis]|uniref:Uncharacterized protein n=1 Tax=Clonorchis sinensis TaxID=79923 RepID=A0A3R7C901_CLOSI|nr:hypothetical protein CSKR_103530 [Clonorchis sinensis]